MIVNALANRSGKNKQKLRQSKSVTEKRRYDSVKNAYERTKIERRKVYRRLKSHQKCGQKAGSLNPATNNLRHNLNPVNNLNPVRNRRLPELPTIPAALTSLPDPTTRKLRLHRGKVRIFLRDKIFPVVIHLNRVLGLILETVFFPVSINPHAQQRTEKMSGGMSEYSIPMELSHKKKATIQYHHQESLLIRPSPVI